MGFILGLQSWFSIKKKKKSVNLISHIHSLKKKYYMIILTDTENAFEKIQNPFMINS